MIFIPTNVPSSKNSRVWTGRFFIASKTTRNYIKNTESYWFEYKSNFLEMIGNSKPPYKVSFFFYRDSKRRFDYINACQILADTMVKNGWIEDDNADFFNPIFLGYKVVPKDKSGVEISTTQ